MAVSSYQFHVNHACLHDVLSLPYGLKSPPSRAYPVPGDGSGPDCSLIAEFFRSATEEL